MGMIHGGAITYIYMVSFRFPNGGGAEDEHESAQLLLECRYAEEKLCLLTESARMLNST